MPFTNKNEYKIFTFGKTYQIKSECIEKVKNIESYREYIWSARPYIWLPILILSGILSGFISYLFYEDFTNIKGLTVYISIIIYILFSMMYYLRIRKVISC